LENCKLNYASASWAQKYIFFNTTYGVQIWNVPNNRYNEIVCYGARGGTAPSAQLSNVGTGNCGNGVVIKSYAYLKSLDILSIVVGQQGGSSHGSKILCNIAIAGDGGGGSFVYNGDLLYCGAGGNNDVSSNGFIVSSTINANNDARVDLSATPGNGGNIDISNPNQVGAWVQVG
jgi:hypothetical protein|tara:strand:- start:697 stop:1221 length:525 start_codon:yes stop_codon:yes gene_type:complete